MGKALGLERYRGGVARKALQVGRDPVLDLGKQAGICQVMEFGCSGERKQRGQSCGEDGVFSDVERGGRLRKGYSETLGLCPKGDADPGLQHGCDQGPTMVAGGKWDVWGLGVILPDSSSGVWLEEVGWSL